MLTPFSPTDSTLIVSVQDLAVHLRLDTPISTDDDALLTAYSLSAQSYAEKLRGEVFNQQTFIYSIANPTIITDSVYPTKNEVLGLANDVLSYIQLPISPLISVSSVKYYDLSNTIQTMPTTCYRVLSTRPALIVFNNQLPSLYAREDAIKITFSAGYDGTVNVLPEIIKIALRLLSADWYRNRERLVEGRLVEIPLGAVPMVDRLLTIDRIRAC